MDNNVGNRAIHNQRMSGYYPTTNQGLIDNPHISQGTWYRSDNPNKSSISVRHDYNPYFKKRSNEATYNAIETNGNNKRYFSMRGNDLNNYMSANHYSQPSYEWR